MHSKYLLTPFNWCYKDYSTMSGTKKSWNNIASTGRGNIQNPKNRHQLTDGSRMVFTPEEESSFVACQMSNCEFPVMNADSSSDKWIKSGTTFTKGDTAFRAIYRTWLSLRVIAKFLQRKLLQPYRKYFELNGN